MHHLGWSFLMMLAMTLGMSGCTSMEERASEATITFNVGIEQTKQGDYQAAQTSFQQAHDQLTDAGKPPKEFYTERHYLMDSGIDSTRGYAHFLEASQLYGAGGDWRPRIVAADQHYRQAIETLRIGTAREVEILTSREVWKRRGKIAGAVLLGMAAAAADASQTQANAYNAQMTGASTYQISHESTELYLQQLAQAEASGFFDMPDIQPIPLALGGSPDAHSVRFPVVPNQGLFRSIGKLVNVTASGECTAFLVAPRVALTNAHCVGEGNELYWSSEEVSRLPTRHDVLLWATGDGAMKKGFKASLAGNDWAVLILAQSAAKLPWLPLVPGLLSSYKPETFSHALLAGYNGDLNSGYYLTAHFGCLIRGVVHEGRYTSLTPGQKDAAALNHFLGGRLKDFQSIRKRGGTPDFLPEAVSLDGGLLHDCDTYFGSSGAPILVYSPEHAMYLVAGINQGQFKDLAANGPLRQQRIGVSVPAFYNTYLAAKQIVEDEKL